MPLNDAQIVFIEPLPAPVVTITPSGDDSLLIYTYENNLYHYVINTVRDTLEIVQVGAIGLHGIVRAPARVRAVTWYIPEYQLRRYPMFKINLALSRDSGWRSFPGCHERFSVISRRRKACLVAADKRRQRRIEVRHENHCARRRIFQLHSRSVALPERFVDDAVSIRPRERIRAWPESGNWPPRFSVVLRRTEHAVLGRFAGRLACAFGGSGKRSTKPGNHPAGFLSHNLGAEQSSHRRHRARPCATARLSICAVSTLDTSQWFQISVYCTATDIPARRNFSCLRSCGNI